VRGIAEDSAKGFGGAAYSECAASAEMDWESENPKRNSGDMADSSLPHRQPMQGETGQFGVGSRVKDALKLLYRSDSAGSAGNESDVASEHKPSRAQARSEASASEDTSEASYKGVPGSSRWLKERNEALEEERLALVKQTLEVQGLLDSIKLKVRTAREITAGLELSAGLDDPSWALESERMLAEKQELISRLIVQSQQAFFMAKVRVAVTCECKDWLAVCLWLLSVVMTTPLSLALSLSRSLSRSLARSLSPAACHCAGLRRFAQGLEFRLKRSGFNV
jgi:hypothetical protein